MDPIRTYLQAVEANLKAGNATDVAFSIPSISPNPSPLPISTPFP